MKLQSKSVATSALWWAFMLSAASIIVPVIFALIDGKENFGGFVATKLVTGIGMFPIIFIFVFIWGFFSKKDPITGIDISTTNKNTKKIQINQDD